MNSRKQSPNKNERSIVLKFKETNKVDFSFYVRYSNGEQSLMVKIVYGTVIYIKRRSAL